MAIYDLFSKRQKKLRDGVPDVYTYDDIPNALRVQIVHIWNDSLGTEMQFTDTRSAFAAYTAIVDALCREYGNFVLPEKKQHGTRNQYTSLCNFFLQVEEIEKTIDVIELSFQVIDTLTRDFDYLYRRDSSEIADRAIAELNERFKEHGVGYHFVEGEIIRIDSELIHVEAVIPALTLLHQSIYQGAQQEFLSAYDHYRHGNNAEALNECLKAFESTMKIICDKRNWPHNDNATAATLVSICLENQLIPAFWENHYNSLRSMLQSGIPTGRNRLGAHGQGTNAEPIPTHLVAYMLHMTASTIVFLATAEENRE